MTSKMTPATPLPWEATRRDDANGNWTTCDIGQARNLGGWVVARTLGVDCGAFENAAYLAHAANQYVKLVAALKLIHDEHRGNIGDVAGAALLEAGEL